MDRKEAKKLEVLDRCLTRIQLGEASVSSCLSAHPAYAQELAPLLVAASHLRAQLAPPGPSPSYAANAKIRILNQIRPNQKKRKVIRPPHRRRFWALKPAYAILSLVMIFGLLFSGIGVLQASAQALPGEALYNVKRGLEEARLTLTMSASGDAELLTRFADERLEELDMALSIGSYATAALALEEYGAMLNRLLVLANDEDLQDEPEVIDKIHYVLAHHEEILRSVLEKAPDSAAEGIQQALEKSSHGKAVIEQIQQGGHPSDRAPGQEKTQEPEDPVENHGQDNPKEKTPGPPAENENTGPKPKEKTPGPPERPTPKPPKDK